MHLNGFKFTYSAVIILFNLNHLLELNQMVSSKINNCIVLFDWILTGVTTWSAVNERVLHILYGFLSYPG